MSSDRYGVLVMKMSKIHSAATILDRNNLIKYDRKSGYFQLKLEGLSLSSDMLYINQSARRLLRALFEIVLKNGMLCPGAGSRGNMFNKVVFPSLMNSTLLEEAHSKSKLLQSSGVSHNHLSDHLSELVENTLSDLEARKCIAIEDDVAISPLNFGMIASYYSINYTTIERFSSSLTPKTKMKGLLEILASASEYEQLPIRPAEEDVTHRLINHQRFSLENPRCTYPHLKANALLQAHFSRQHVGGNPALDQQEVVPSAGRLLQAMVDVISSNGWLNLTLLAMEVSQMGDENVSTGENITLLVTLERDLEGKAEVGPESQRGRLVARCG
ncbi:hypothetical protein Dsin_013346 [Dipteronia sinensis]|uniref:SEC63 domain-containing protein n=1 Tax=Dipteronia sinensis TaxID=43782 RepID=A0AAE0AJY3_9ROSI|nr:hypothetical protein Dsin_013346 [Dipteronia sinensis]